MKLYSLRKSKKILLSVYQLWRRKSKKLLPAQKGEIQNDLRTLQEEIIKKNEGGADYMARKCTDYAHGILKKSSLEKLRDFVFAIVFALAIALVIRQVWFELYEIPTGSMRPTFKEKDRLIVSKTTFGVNIPFSVKHFVFDPDLVERSGIFIFSAENIPIHDPDTLYFWLFPGKKQLVKRVMGKPGDTVYFYGGQLYGFDKDGTDISSELQRKELDLIDHIPVIRFSGNVALSEPFRTNNGTGYGMAVLYQMNEAVARLTADGGRKLEGEMLFTPSIHNRSAPPVKNYFDLWGIGNYAKARIVSKDQIRNLAVRQELELQDDQLYMELEHHPDLKRLELGPDLWGRLRPQFDLYTSVIPLNEDHLKVLFKGMYTTRFVVSNGYAKRYWMGGAAGTPTHFLTRLDGVKDGTYEFYHGQAYQVLWGGMTKKLGANHPLMRYSSLLVEKLFNNGIEFDLRTSIGDQFETGRFAYFRKGDLYLMGTPVFKKGDPILSQFLAAEDERRLSANEQNPYPPFVDSGPPLLDDGTLDREKVNDFGLLIPPHSYLALGDNFAESADSRDFGFVPQGNIRGAPSFIFWPFGPRFGPPNQPAYPWVTLPNVIVWFLAAIGLGIWYGLHKAHHRLPLKDL